MGLWPFGRTRADVETTSRVVVLRARDAVALRAKVTVKFEEPQTQAAAEQTLDTCQDLVRAVVREAPSGASVLGFDAAIASEVHSRLPAEIAAVRSVEIAGLHIVGDPGHLAQPSGGTEQDPAWLHAPSKPASSDSTQDRSLDRPTPVHGFPPARAPAERSLDRPTPVQGVAPVKAPPERSAPVKPRDPFAATAQSPQPAPKAPPRAPVLEPASSAANGGTAAARREEPKANEPADARRTEQAQRSHAPPEAPPAEARRQQANHPIAHAPTMPAIAAQTPVQAPAAARVALADAPVTAPPDTSPAARTPREPSRGVYSGVSPSDPTPGPGAVQARDPQVGATASRADPNAVRGRSGSTFPPPGHGQIAAPYAASNAMRPPPGPRRTSSSGQMAAVSLEDAARAQGLGSASIPGLSRTSDDAASRGAGGPPSTGRGSRVPDEPVASSRTFTNLAAQSAGSRNGPVSRSSNRPPPAAVAARRRVVASRLLLPMGAGPYEVARGLTPLFRDTAGRILVAFLRTYDLTVIRRVPLDAVESDILSSLTAPSDGAPGTYAASHATEIQRWREAFGAAKLDRLQREANLAAAALAHEMFTAEAVPSSMTAAVVEGLAGSAFGDPDMLLDIGRYLYPARETTSAEAVSNMIELAGEEMPPGLLNSLDPLFSSLREEVAAVAELAKEVMLTPA